MELMDIISSIPPTDFAVFEKEYVVEGNYETRENIIYYLTMDKEWDIECEMSSSNNIWYLFVNKNFNVSVSINCGTDSFYNDIVLTKFN